MLVMEISAVWEIYPDNVWKCVNDSADDLKVMVMIVVIFQFLEELGKKIIEERWV